MAPWKLPVLVLAIAVPIAVSFYYGGPGLGVAAGAVVAVAIVVVAARQKPHEEIGAAAGETPRRLLVAVAGPLEDPAAVAAVAAVANGAETEREPAAEVIVLAPVRIGFLDRWAGDVEGAREDAQQRLVVSVAALAAAGIGAEARVGDENLVQAVEDQLGSFAATDVVLIGDGGDRGAAAAAADLRSRLRGEFRWVELSGRGINNPAG